MTDSYFGQRRNTRNGAQEGDQELLKNHYKFHKGTTYAIGTEKDRQVSFSNAQESFVPKLRQGRSEV